MLHVLCNLPGLLCWSVLRFNLTGFEVSRAFDQMPFPEALVKIYQESHGASGSSRIESSRSEAKRISFPGFGALGAESVGFGGLIGYLEGW